MEDSTGGKIKKGDLVLIHETSSLNRSWQSFGILDGTETAAGKPRFFNHHGNRLNIETKSLIKINENIARYLYNDSPKLRSLISFEKFESLMEQYNKMNE